MGNADKMLTARLRCWRRSTLRQGDWRLNSQRSERRSIDETILPHARIFGAMGVNIMAIAVAIVSSNNGFIGAASSREALQTQASPGPGFVGPTRPLGTRSRRPSSRTSVYMASQDRRLERRDLPVYGMTPHATIDAWCRLAWSPQGLRRIRICAT